MAPFGMSDPSVLPAFCGSDSIEAGILNTAQCHQPLLVGASGSNTVSTKLLVPEGNPCQCSVGERSSPPAFAIPERAHWGNVPPASKSGLSSLNEGTTGRFQFGSFTMAVLSRVN